MSANLEIKPVLFCDFEGAFPYCETLSQLGYQVDQILPESLKHVSVGDHLVYVFAFADEENMESAFKISEKLKRAQLKTPIMLLYLSGATPTFLNHQSMSKNPADAYVADPATESVVLDAIDSLVGTPIPPGMKGVLTQFEENEEQRQVMDLYRRKIHDLETKLKETEGVQSGINIDKALEAQRKLSKTKLDQLLKGQKLQLQTETERLQVQLSELQAKLMDREARVKELERDRENHEKALQKLREFYLHKIKQIENQNAGKSELKSLKT